MKTCDDFIEINSFYTNKFTIDFCYFVCLYMNFAHNGNYHAHRFHQPIKRREDSCAASILFLATILGNRTGFLCLL